MDKMKNVCVLIMKLNNRYFHFLSTFLELNCTNVLSSSVQCLSLGRVLVSC